MPLSKIQLSSSTGRRNLVINGAMQVAQRGTTGTATGDGNYLSVDRFKWRSYGGAGRASIEQSTDTPTGEYRYSLKATVTTVNSGLDQYDSAIGHIIEGYNRLPLGWGTSSPSPCTISFWVKTSIAGVYSVSMRVASASRSQVQETPSLSANTWTKVTLTFVGDTDSDWLNYATNGTGLILEFNLGRSNAKNTTTLGSWVSGNKVASDNQVRWIENNGATFFITGVQIEKGSAATQFEHLSFAEELTLCRRYFQRVGEITASNLGSMPGIQSTRNTTNQALLSYQCPVPLRATPSVSKSGSFTLYGSGQGITLGSILAVSTNQHLLQQVTFSATATGINSNTDQVLFGSGTNSYIQFDSEM